ncbi:unnamed protein product [Symbiodinium natans]|uniref:Uncharacterized protein n=1 Tax=Symbiodinium natans TaxID=878477 RepID=A0A812UD19_9DINO|nr:unnamed protein product [Symbiodinium natans]
MQPLVWTNCLRLVLASLGSLCLVWFVFLYGDLFVIVSTDATVCPVGSELGGAATAKHAISEEPCIGGHLVRPCMCVEGFQPRVTKMRFWASDYHFRCCSEPAGPVPTGDALYLQVMGPLLLVMGIVGMFTCGWIIHRSVRLVDDMAFSQEDHAVENSLFPLEGASLHRTVDMHKWGVTLDDLLQFRRLVSKAVADGRIKPTDLDPFDPADVVKGPSMYSVTEQYIKVLTRRAGNVSWALMKHPKGISCDLFITHAWAEGIFEFVDKVSNSWPTGANAAYVCFLSNPQNLDIGDLITSPSESPFAKALTAAKEMLVVPNKTTSIYTRVWCVYEAFLAFRLEKPIRTALSPIPHFWPRVLRTVFAGMAFHGLGFLIMSQATTDSADQIKRVEQVGLFSGLACLIFLTFLYKTNRHDWKLLQVAIYVCGAVFAMYRISLSYRKGFKRSNNMIFMTVAVFFMAGLEMDRLLALDGRRQTSQLKSGFEGIEAAKSANAADAERIRKEIRAIEGQEREVDHAVRVLLDMNVFAKDLQEITRRTGALGDISTWSRSLFVLSVLWWVTNTNQIWIGRILRHDYEEMADGLRWLVFVGAALEAVTFYTLFVFGPAHRKAFAERLEALVVVPVVLTYSGLFQGPSYEVFYVFGVNSVIVLLAAAGPGRVAQVPVVGAPIVRALFGRNPFKAAIIAGIAHKGELHESPSGKVSKQQEEEEDLVEV